MSLYLLDWFDFVLYRGPLRQYLECTELPQFRNVERVMENFVIIELIVAKYCWSPREMPFLRWRLVTWPTNDKQRRFSTGIDHMAKSLNLFIFIILISLDAIRQTAVHTSMIQSFRLLFSRSKSHKQYVAAFSELDKELWLIHRQHCSRRWHHRRWERK
jgi:hypothetical protein